MKPVYLIILTLFFFVTSCEKSVIKPSDLDGEWKLTSTNGGLLPATTPLMDIKLVINGSDYQVFYQGQLTHSSKFSLVKVDETIDNHKYSYKLDFENSQMLDVYVDIENNELRMQSGSIAVDHVISFYKKQ